MNTWPKIRPHGFWLTLAVCVALPALAPGDTVRQQWVRQYDGPAQKEDGASAIAIDEAGAVFVVGFSVGEFIQDGLLSIRKHDFRTAKYSAADGVLLWEQRHRGQGNDFNFARAVVVDSRGDVIVTGQSDGGVFVTSTDIYTAKYAGDDGRLLWERRYNNPVNRGDEANAIAVDAEGNVVITGSTTTSAQTGRTDYYTAKYSGADGALIWERLYNGPASRSDRALKVVIDPDGNAIVTGFSEASNLLNDFYTVKYAKADGAVLWERRYDGPDGPSGDDSVDTPTGLAVDSIGNIAITGASHAGGGVEQTYTAKYSGADGSITWEKRTVSIHAAAGMDGAGNLLVTGSTAVPAEEGRMQRDVYTAKYASSNGALLWERTYAGPAKDDDSAVALRVDAAGNSTVTARVKLSETPLVLHSYTARYAAPDGNLLWEKLYPGGSDSSNDVPADLALTPDGGAAICGSTVSNNADALIIKYTPGGKLVNISTRMRVETGDNALIAGFIIAGNSPKKVLVRGIGPSLPVSGALADPVLSLDNGAVVNDDWKSTQEQEIRSTSIPPTSDLESAIVATLQPGPHTAILRGKNNRTGVGLVEVYDLESATPVQLANISTRGLVQAGDNVMIGGFIVGGDYPAKVLLRAIGPSLSVTGKLADPTLELVDANGGRITNDDWRATQEAEIIATTVPPTNEKEAAIVATLAPGFYTAVVRGKDDSVGVALVEGYTLQ